MDRQFITTSETPKVTIEVQGDLRLRGHDELKVAAKCSSEEDLTLQEREGGVWISATTDCSVRVPRKAELYLKVVHGNATIKGVNGVLSGDVVHGNLTLRDVGETSINTVYRQIDAKNIAGSLCFDRVDGNLQVKDVQGVFTITGSASGNLRLDDVGMGAAAEVDGNITLRLDPGPGEKYEFKAGGNIFCRLPEDTSVDISIPSAAQVMVNVAGARSTAPIKTPYSLTLGDGEASLTLIADGNVVLDRHAPDWEGIGDIDVEIGAEMEGMADVIGQQIEAQLDAQMAMVEQQLDLQMASLELRLNSIGLSEEQARRAEERARAANQRAQERTQERMRLAQERMERKIAEAQRKIQVKAHAAERGARRGRPPLQFTIPPAPPRPPRVSVPAAPVGEPVSEQERLMILRMLEQNTISLDQAEKLLSALEGKE